MAHIGGSAESLLWLEAGGCGLRALVVLFKCAFHLLFFVCGFYSSSTLRDRDERIEVTAKIFDSSQDGKTLTVPLLTCVVQQQVNVLLSLTQPTLPFCQPCLPHRICHKQILPLVLWLPRHVLRLSTAG